MTALPLGVDGEQGGGRAYYNERDPYAAAWLRNLISAGHIAPGDVDERDIRDVRPDELVRYTQCHFFAGIGVWSHALRRAGWADDAPIWTGSCPCQPFSAAGKRGGVDDERHLWPHWHWLIEQCRPAIVLGEQVASKDGLGWLDLVSADMEGTGYAFGASDLCAAGFGGAHIRQRLYFVGMADASNGGRREQRSALVAGNVRHVDRSGDALGGLGNANGARTAVGIPEPSQRQGGHAKVDDDGSDRLLRSRQGRSAASWLVDANGRDACPEGLQRSRIDGCEPQDSVSVRRGDQGCERDDRSELDRTGAPMLRRNAADWLYCRDGKWRPVEPGTFPLAHAAPARVGRLRAYGNALDAETASQFAGAVREMIATQPMRAAA